MGICPHCMQNKPIAANKCPYCHERTGILESAFWWMFHSVVKVVVLIICVLALYQCTGAKASTGVSFEQVNK